jgi:hypothetical protein
VHVLVCSYIKNLYTVKRNVLSALSSDANDEKSDANEDDGALRMMVVMSTFMMSI